MNRIFRALLFSLLTGLFPVGMAEAQTTLSDGDFAPGDWTYDTRSSSPGDVLLSAGQVPAGGNPDSYYRTSFTVEQSFGITSIYEPFVWDTNLDGPIMALDFSLDFTTFDSEQTMVFFTVLVGGEYYGYMLGMAQSNTAWETLAHLGPVVPTQFMNLDPDGGGGYPDFTSGGVIRFGFSTGQVGSGSPITLNHGIDNWQVTVNPAQTWYEDFDGDGHGNPLVTLSSTTQPAGYVASNDDCDDTEPTVYPGAFEYCDDGLDNDCNLEVDEDYGQVAELYVDNDLDGYGSAETVVETCSAPSPGWVTNSLDCLDSDPDVYPGAEELCDGIDNDCDGEIDEGLGSVIYHVDADLDGFGDAGSPVYFCEDPGPGYVLNNLDCDDSDDTIHPGAEDICDGIDNDCNGVIDDGPGAVAYHVDADLDGFGDASVDPVYFCGDPGPGYSLSADDCDDNDDAIHPGAEEICDGVDNDCNGEIDEGLATSTWYADEDLDGYGGTETFVEACQPPADGAWTLDGSDCNDFNPDIHPGAEEICDGMDNDCDGEVDEGCGNGSLVFEPTPLPVGCGDSASLSVFYSPAGDAPGLRGYEITVRPSPEISFSAASFLFSGAMQALADTDPEVELFANITENWDGSFTLTEILAGPTPGIASEVALFSIELTGLVSGTGAVLVDDALLRSLDNADIPVSVASSEVVVDCDGPEAITQLAASPGHGKVHLSWGLPPEDGVTTAVFRSLWHDGSLNSVYPEYDDDPGWTVPTAPATYDEALADPAWTPVATTLTGESMYDDDVLPRGIYVYQLYSIDRWGNPGEPSATTVAATNYWLGDVDGDPGPDGYVSVPDLNLLGAAYGLTGADLDFDPALDIGPTDDFSRFGLPRTDNHIDFEDLMVMAMNFGVVDPSLKSGGSSFPDLQWRPLEDGRWTLSLAAPAADLKGLHLAADLSGGSAPLVQTGELLAHQTAPVFLRNIDRNGLDLGLVILGQGATLQGSGDLVILQLPAGFDPSDIDLVARDSANRTVTAAVAVPGNIPAPKTLGIGAYPNPLNPMTTVWVDLPEAGAVDLKIYDLAGRLVRVLRDQETLSAGRHEIVWQGRDGTGTRVSSGTYFCRVNTAGGSQTTRLILVK